MHIELLFSKSAQTNWSVRKASAILDFQKFEI